MSHRPCRARTSSSIYGDERIKAGVFVRVANSPWQRVGRVIYGPYMTGSEVLVTVKFDDEGGGYLAIIWPILKCTYLARDEYELATLLLGEDYFQ